MGDKTRGLYHKFTILRTDGASEPGGKHEGCDYFVLDLTHDPHALPALMAYAMACKDEHPLLYKGLMVKLAAMTPRRIWTRNVRPFGTPVTQCDYQDQDGWCCKGKRGHDYEHFARSRRPPDEDDCNG